MKRTIIWLLGLLAIVAGCGMQDGEDERAVEIDKPLAIKALRFIGEQRLVSSYKVGDTVVGGLSGIDQGPDGIWYLLSDDRSESSAARFYEARLMYTAERFDSVAIGEMHVLLRPDGTPFPEAGVDPEAIRFDVASGSLWWTSEGDRNQLQGPFIRQMGMDGTYQSDVPLPPLYAMSDQEIGPRNNGVFESLSFSADGKDVWVTTELPLLQDGPAPTPTPADAPVRLTLLDKTTGEIKAQYAYMLDPVAQAPMPETAFFVSGVTEILAVADNRLLVLERSFSMGRGFVVKVYQVETRGATDVRDEAALSNASFQPVQKTLLLDFADIADLSMVSNVEGVAFGPNLPNGNPTLVFVADNNFNAFLMTQFMAFEVIPE